MATPEFVNSALVKLALDRIEGFPFERFAHDFLAALLGRTFVPLGGVKDGGADAFDECVWEISARSDFYQATVEEDVEGKVRRTHRRLVQVGRNPERIYLVTPKAVRSPDQLELALEEELDCTITIRDGNYIAAHINDSPETRATFWQHLYPLTDYIRDLARPSVAPPSSYVDRPHVYTFLAQEASRNESNSVPAAMVDALILWALEGTDPDAGILRSQADINARIKDEVPGVSSLASTLLGQRLRDMSKKTYKGGRAIKWHRQEDAYCLPHETRLRLEADKVEDETLRLEFTSSLEQRCIEAGVQRGDVSLAGELSVAVLRRIYEKEGLEFSAFLEGRSPGEEYPTVTHLIREEMVSRHLRRTQKERLGPQVLDVMRRVLYTPNRSELAYLQRIARTYALLFSLASHPEVASFFNDAAARFYLYVGSDVLIRAMSENLLPDAGQVTGAALEAAVQAGSTLILTEPVLEEVMGHLRACDQEHKHNFTVTDVLPRELAREAPHIMLRAYLYSRIDAGPTAPKSWEGFVHRMVDYEDLYRQSGVDSLAAYLKSKFGLTYVSREELEQLTMPEEVALLAMDLGDSKSHQALADNDALLCMAVYGRREAEREGKSASEFGLETWWLTWERSILALTRELVERRGARYIMRPEFLLRFIGLSPNRQEVRDTHQSVFASVLGFSLGRRVSSEAFHGLMAQFNEAELLEPARRATGVRKLVDSLKGDMSRQYGLDMGGQPIKTNQI